MERFIFRKHRGVRKSKKWEEGSASFFKNYQLKNKISEEWEKGVSLPRPGELVYLYKFCLAHFIAVVISTHLDTYRM
jgi:hypothetical protein